MSAGLCFCLPACCNCPVALSEFATYFIKIVELRICKFQKLQLQQEKQTAKFNLLRKCGLLAHTSAAFLKNCCTEKLFCCLRLDSYNPPAPNFFFLPCIISDFPHKLFPFPRGTIFIKVRIFTMEMKKNDHIHCSVTQCKHNMGTENYCCLNSITIGTHEPNPTVPECTDCFSFVKRSCCE